MDWLKQALADMIEWIGELFKSTFKALWDILKDVFAWLFEKFLEIGIDALREIDVSGLEGVEGWGSLPSEILNVLGLLGIGQATSIVVAAIGVRKSLRFIPFIGR